MQFRKEILFPVLIALAGLLAYVNTVNAPFQFDDDAYIVNNPVIRTFHFFRYPGDIFELTEQSPNAVPPAVRSAFMTRIVAHFSFAVNYHLHGLAVQGYHLVNIGIHIVNGLLLFLIMKRLSRGSGPESNARRQSEVTAGITALLFVIHPIQTQAVTYLSQRFASLAALFSFASILLYMKSCSSNGTSRKVSRGASLLSATAAMLTKECSITLPVLLALYDMVFLTGTLKERAKRLAPYAVTLAIIPVLLFVQQPHVGQLDNTMRTLTAADTSGISRGHYLLTQFPVVALYLRLLFVPIGLNVDHDIAVRSSLFELPVLVSFLTLLCLFAAAVALILRRTGQTGSGELKVAGFGILWFFLTLSVESSVIPLGELAAEYRLYLPSAGMIIAVGSLVRYGAESVPSLNRARPALPVLCVIVAVPLLVATVLRNSVWSSECSLWEDAARKSPGLVRPHQNLAFYYGRAGRLEEAKQELITALRRAPGNFELHNNLGVLSKQLGAYDDAVREYRRVLELQPGDVMARFNLGNLYLEQGRVGDAVREYELTARLIPDYDDVHNNLGIAYHKSGRTADAIREFRRALELNPGNRNAGKNLSESLRQARQPQT